MGFFDDMRSLRNAGRAVILQAAQKLGADPPVLTQRVIDSQAQDRRVFVREYQVGDEVGAVSVGEDNLPIDGVVVEELFEGADKVAVVVEAAGLGSVVLHTDGAWWVRGTDPGPDSWLVVTRVMPRGRPGATYADVRDDAWEATNERREGEWRTGSESRRRTVARARHHVELPQGSPVSGHGDVPWRISATSKAFYLHANRRPDAPRYIHLAVPFGAIRHVDFGRTRLLGGERSTLQLELACPVNSLPYASDPEAPPRRLDGVFFPFKQNRWSHKVILHATDASDFVCIAGDLLRDAGVELRSA